MAEYIHKMIEDCNAALSSAPKRSKRYQGAPGEPPQFDEVRDYVSAIYVFREINGDPKKTFESLKKYKATSERSCPRLNSESSVLYVGSSIGNVAERLRQHVGPTNMLRTSALHLDRWFEGAYEIVVDEYDLSPKAIQILEDSISFELRPAFGKKGGNNSV